MKKDNAETQSTQRFRRKEASNLGNEIIFHASESKLHGAEKREVRAAGVNIFETLAGLESGSSGCENDILAERRAIFRANAEILSNVVADGRLEKEKFERLGTFEAEKVEIGETAKFGR